jgi:ArsR family transcriptional regulator
LKVLMMPELMTGLETQGDNAALWDRVLEDMPDEESLYDLAELFKVFGDTTRIRILYVLFEAEMCVCDIAQILNMTQSAISHQLRVLKQARLVRNRREGKQIYYSLADDHVRTIIGQGMDHIDE